MTAPGRESTGIPGLDDILQNLKRGDNVVWQVDEVDDFIRFIEPYVERAKKDGKKIIYIRFAEHKPLLKESDQVAVHQLDAKAGFETFAKQVHDIITAGGVGAFYVFDCLSDLLSAWATDLMIGNFFMVTCPYLFKLDTIAYFALLRDRHSFKTIARIRETTQLLLDLYNFENNYYVHPLKVWNRYSPTMFLPHLMKEDRLIPLSGSNETSRLFDHISVRLGESSRHLDYWDRLFIEAEEAVKKEPEGERSRRLVDQICEIMMGREKKMLELVKKNFTLEDLLAIKQRIIGTGYIGGKALGMLLARKILKPEWSDYLEPHDSFYVGSDVFYTYIVQNGWWEEWLEHKREDSYFAAAAELLKKMKKGSFPDEIKEQFYRMIEYFGQSPIIVRSSSLLEDGFGSAFAGKYESIFDVNQGSPEDRYARLEELIREVFSSTLSEDALTYRLQRGLNRLDEQMALLIQRVSGERHGRYFFPFLAGVGISNNPFVWHNQMDPQAGMVRLVFGLGTRAVGRAEGDYSKVMALDMPEVTPYSSEEAKTFSQHDLDLLDIEQNALRTVAISDLLAQKTGVSVDLIGYYDRERSEKLKKIGAGGEVWTLDFKKLIRETSFIADIQKILKKLEEAYGYPVDIEYTVNLTKENKLTMNLVQCRPLQSIGTGKNIEIPEKISRSNLLIRSEGNFMGGNVFHQIIMLVYVDPPAYGDLLMGKKFEVARMIGRLNRQIGDKDKNQAMLIGPGRWGSRDASLGVPVSFAEINNFTALMEMDDPERGFRPELSFASHFFLDLVEAQIFYAALFMDKERVHLDKDWIKKQENILARLLPEEGGFANTVKVIDLAKKPLKLVSDMVKQKFVVYK